MKDPDRDLSAAWQRVKDGRSTKDDGTAVIAHLADLTGYYSVPDFEGWIAKFGTAAGFELHCARQAARREVFAQILTALNIDPKTLAQGG